MVIIWVHMNQIFDMIHKTENLMHGILHMIAYNCLLAAHHILGSAFWYNPLSFSLYFDSDLGGHKTETLFFVCMRLFI